MKLSEYLNQMEGWWSLFIIAIFCCGILVLAFSCLKIYRMVKRKEYDLGGLNYILLFGSLALMIGLLHSGISLSLAMKAISIAGDVSQSLVADGIRYWVFDPIVGLVIFIVSLIFWGILKEINLKKMKTA